MIFNNNFFRAVSGCIALMMAVSMLWSCKKDDSTTPSAPAGNSLSSQVQNRWAVSGAAFCSIEFNNSNQAIVVFGQNVQNADSIRSYFYRVVDSKNLDVKNFGKILVNSISNSNMEFQFTPIGGSASSLSAAKAGSAVGTASNTSLFCRTWKMDKWLVGDTTILDFDTIGTVTATFTSAGTYFVQGTVLLGDSAGVDEEGNMMSWWKWNPSFPGDKFCYSHESENFECDSSNVVTINTLTSSEMILTENILTYHLLPYTLPARVAVQPGKKRLPRLPKNSFFVK
jgi:hypothetical protein